MRGGCCWEAAGARAQRAAPRAGRLGQARPAPAPRRRAFSAHASSGAMSLQGPHQLAQNSTSTGLEVEAWRGARDGGGGSG